MKKLLFVACLLVPLGLFAYGKLKPYYDNYKAVSGVTSVIRNIPLTPPSINDAFKQLPAMPARPVAPKAPVKRKVVKPLPKPVVVAPAPQPEAEAPLVILPDARELIETCRFGFLSIHCAFE